MTAPDVAARVTAWLDRLEAELPPATPEPFWQRCGCLSLVGEIPSVDYCHQAGLCAMRERERERDEAARALLALARGVATLHVEVEGSGGPCCNYDGFVWPCYEARLLADAAPDTGEETA